MEFTALVVDDSDDFRESLMTLLTSLGFESRGAHNGAEALELLSRIETPSLILLDLSMPVMNGSEFRDHQLRDPRLSQIPTILISADAELRQIATRLKISAVVPKPVDEEVLIGAIHRYCDPYDQV